MTLLEVLVASALLAVFFVGVFSIVFGVIRTRREIEDKAIPWATGPAVMQRVVEDLLYTQTETIDGDKDAFKGSGERPEDIQLDFVTAVPSRDQVEIGDVKVRAELNEVGYRLRRSESDRDLYALYRREDFSVDSDPSEGGRYFKLCDRVREFKIDYYEQDPGDPAGDGADGVPTWDARKEGKMPWGCRVTLVLAADPEIEAQDDSGVPPQDHVFQTYVPFRTRYDKTDAAKPGGQQPGR